MQWCQCFGQVLWASVMVPVSLPLLLLLFVLASVCGLTGWLTGTINTVFYTISSSTVTFLFIEFLVWLFPSNVFSNKLVERGNKLASTAMKIFYWCLLKNSDVGFQKKKKARNGTSHALQSTQTLVDHVINMTQQPVPLASRLPFTVPRSTIIYGFPKIGFTYQELAAATNGFAARNLLGEGGFGKVYKGVLQNGLTVAVKCLSPAALRPHEFYVELDVVSRLHHRNLIQLVGCSITKGKSLLVYEYIPNGSLDNHLLGKRSKTIDWPTRVKVALGSAKAISYLHEDCQPRVVHRDIKPANILLDEHFQPKVADFGLGKFFPDDVTHIETRIIGTLGHAAPEYIATGVLTEKCDVYAYGIVLLQLITGKMPVVPDSEPNLLVNHIEAKLRPALQNNDFSELVDPRLKNQYSHDELKMMFACAVACTRYSPHERPPISRIALVLGGKLPPETLGSLDDDHCITS